jgi:putative transposon-encoded protein
MRLSMVSGKIILRDIEYEQLLERKVYKNNASSGKINVPKDYIGKRVYVVVPKEED